MEGGEGWREHHETLPASKPGQWLPRHRGSGPTCLLHQFSTLTHKPFFPNSPVPKGTYSPPSGPLSMRPSVPGTLLPVTCPSSTWKLLSFGQQCGHLLLQAGLGAALCTPCPSPPASVLALLEPQKLDKRSSPPPPPIRLSCP